MSTPNEENTAQPETLKEWDEFLTLHVAGRTDRQLLVSVLWHVHKSREEVAALTALVKSIEEEANTAMASLSDPNTMMDAARKFMGG